MLDHRNVLISIPDLPCSSSITSFLTDGHAFRGFLSSKFSESTDWNRAQRLNVLKPDSAVGLDGEREAKPFRNEVDGLVPLSRLRSVVL